MRFRIVLTHHRGVPRARRDIALAAGIIGDLVTAERPDEFLRGSVVVARLVSFENAANMAELLPPLYDAKLKLIARQGLMLKGHERMTPGSGPTIEFVQGWWARPANPEAGASGNGDGRGVAAEIPLRKGVDFVSTFR